MTEIAQRTVWEVDGRQFDTEAAAQAHVRRGGHIAAVADFLFGYTNLQRDDSDDTAAALVDHWSTLRAIMENSRDD